jgi:excisionase family DNA binding protein
MTSTATPQPIERLLTVADVADALSSTSETIRGFIHRGELVASKIGKKYLISSANLSKFVDGKRSR